MGAAMRLWAALYGLIWVVLVEFLLAMKPDGGALFGYAHVALGFGVLGIAFSNARGLRATEAPGRVKRVAAAAFQMSVAVAFFGVLLFLGVGSGWTLLLGLTFFDALLFLHVLLSFAIITQAAAVAIAYDMWEDREFLRTTRPGEVPPPAQPAAPAGRGTV